MTRIANATTEPDEQEEIEITPEMIEAGVVEFDCHSPKFDLEEDSVVRIYRAIVMTKRLGKKVSEAEQP
jgi:hypothetical protein